MNYIACRKFTNTPKGTEDKTDYLPGDPVPDFETWPEMAKFRLLKQNYVQPNFVSATVADDDEDAGKKRAVSKKK